MFADQLVEILNADFYTGVPDSLLKPFCDCLMDKYGLDNKRHVVAANEGNCVALAAGYYLATNKVSVVYMQNSGEGNIINPVASLLNEKVYAIPMIFVIGWRGEPSVYDEPQHIYQGEVTIKLLDDMGIESFVISKETTYNEASDAMRRFRVILEKGKNVAFVIKKNALSYERSLEFKNDNTMSREEIIQHIVAISKEDPIISTTGKASRELFEIRVKNGQRHIYDFLTVGSMGHASSIALGIAVNKPNAIIWCIDGDGAVLMHMGSMAVIGSSSPDNLIHVVINNGSHETVGGMPTVATNIDLVKIAKACGYSSAVCVDNFIDLDAELEAAKTRHKLSFIEVKASIGSRKDLMRPTTTAIENKINFMNYLSDLELQGRNGKKTYKDKD